MISDENEPTHDPEVLLTPLILATPREGGVVNVLVQIKAPHTHDRCAGFDQELGRYAAPFLSDITVILQPCDGVIIVQPACAQQSRLRQHVYQLPDLVQGSESTLLVRMQVEPDERVMRPLLTMKLRATSEMDQCMLHMGGFQLALENIGAEALAALPHDEVVAARMKLEEIQK